MTDVVVIFWRADIAIEDHSDLLRPTAETLHVAQVTVGNFLPSLTLFPLHHVEKPSAINHQTGAGLVSEVERIGQLLQASLGKACLVRLVHFLIFFAKQRQGRKSVHTLSLSLPSYSIGQKLSVG